MIKLYPMHLMRDIGKGEKMGYLLGKKSAYIAYSRPGKTPEARGTARVVTERSDAFVFKTSNDAAREAERLSKRAHGMAPIPTEGNNKRKRFSTAERMSIYLKTGGRCYLCGEIVDFSSFEVEHKVPVAEGGTNDMSNLYCACHLCNAMKGAFSADDVIAQAKKIARNQKLTAAS